MPPPMPGGPRSPEMTIWRKGHIENILNWVKPKMPEKHWNDCVYLLLFCHQVEWGLRIELLQEIKLSGFPIWVRGLWKACLPNFEKQHEGIYHNCASGGHGIQGESVSWAQKGLELSTGKALEELFLSAYLYASSLWGLAFSTSPIPMPEGNGI